jgi:hypothetical protein
MFLFSIVWMQIEKKAWDLLICPIFSPTARQGFPENPIASRTINLLKLCHSMARVGLRWPNPANKPAQQLLYKTSQSHQSMRQGGIQSWRRSFAIHKLIGCIAWREFIMVKAWWNPTCTRLFAEENCISLDLLGLIEQLLCWCIGQNWPAFRWTEDWSHRF